MEILDGGFKRKLVGQLHNEIPHSIKTIYQGKNKNKLKSK